MKEDGRLRIVVFDIPEDQKYDRACIRAELIASGFVMLQKSVWIGRRPLLEKFVRDLATRDLLSCVHIFEIKESGTLHNLDWQRTA
jgi:CRISPR-associated endonuclease Cas2